MPGAGHMAKLERNAVVTAAIRRLADRAMERATAATG
jgi:hypothetical protein